MNFVTVLHPNSISGTYGYRKISLTRSVIKRILKSENNLSLSLSLLICMYVYIHIFFSSQIWTASLININYSWNENFLMIKWAHNTDNFHEIRTMIFTQNPIIGTVRKQSETHVHPATNEQVLNMASFFYSVLQLAWDCLMKYKTCGQALYWDLLPLTHSEEN